MRYSIPYTRPSTLENVFLKIHGKNQRHISFSFWKGISLLLFKLCAVLQSHNYTWSLALVELLWLLLMRSFEKVPNYLQYSKASRYTASSCTDLAGARFWIGSKNLWDARFCTFLHVFACFCTFLINECLRCTFFARFYTFLHILHVFAR